jgi:cysteine-S-conjugate beta-lyase
MALSKNGFDFDCVIDRRTSDSNKWRKYPGDVLPLWVADMDFASPPAVVQALRARVDQGFFGYLMEKPELHEVVAERVAKRYGWHVSPEAVMPLPGVIAGFNLALRALTAPGDGLLVQTPVYPPILRAASNHGLTRDEHALTRGAGGRYAVDVEAFSRALGPRTRAFLLCSPHNPVGRVFERAELEAMAAACARRDVWIIADEIHGDVLFDGRRHVPIATLSPEIEARTVTFMAPSKTFNLPGLKCAVAIVPNAAVRDRLTAAVADLVPKINVLGHAAAVAAYREGDAWLEALLGYLESNRDFLLKEVPRRLPGVTLAAPEATYLAWLDCRGARIPGGDPFTFFLERAKVALNDGRLFGPGGDGFVRLNFGCPRALLAEGLDRMARALAA